MLVASPGSGEPPAAAAAWQALRTAPLSERLPCRVPCGLPAGWPAAQPRAIPAPRCAVVRFRGGARAATLAALPGAAALRRAAGSSELVCLPTAQVRRPRGEEVQAQRGAQQRPRRHDGHHRHDRPQRARRRLALPHRVLDARAEHRNTKQSLANSSPRESSRSQLTFRRSEVSCVVGGRVVLIRS